MIIYALDETEKLLITRVKNTVMDKSVNQRLPKLNIALKKGTSEQTGIDLLDDNDSNLMSELLRDGKC